MSLLSQVTKGKIVEPDLLVIYGPDGVGKSTFAADAPNTLFLGAERGTSNLDVSRLPTPGNLEDVKKSLLSVLNEAHDYKTLAIDSIDWLEQMIWKQICEDCNVKHIELADGGYGKGFIRSLNIFREITDLTTQIRDKKKMNIIFIAHSQVKSFQDPMQLTGYDRYQLKLHDRAAAHFREYVDCVLFATYETYTKENKEKKTRAYGDGSRVLYTERRPAYDAKNRFSLPEMIPLSWDDYVSAKNKAPVQADNSKILADITELCNEVKDEELKKKITQSVVNANGNLKTLTVILNRLRTVLNK